jgi:T-complex protein 1 subunit delta
MSNTIQAREQNQKTKDVRGTNIIAARAVADAVRTSLGPRGMDKMIMKSKGDVIITNDGATILKQMELAHPCAKMLVDLAKAQDVEVGDGTTTVTVLAGALLAGCQDLLAKGIHPTTIAEGYQRAAAFAIGILRANAEKVDLSNRESLIQSAKTSLNSKIVSQYSNTLAPLAVDAVLKVIDAKTATNVDLNDIKIVKLLGGTIEDTHLVEGLVFNQNASHAAGGPVKIEKAKIALIQFQLSSPKTNMDGKIIMDNYQALDRVLKQERLYILDLCKRIKKEGCNVLLIQKSILRDAVNDMALQYLAKLGIMVVKEIERDDVEFISRTLGCIPIASIESFHASKLGSAELVEEMNSPGGKVVKVTGVPNASNICTVVVRGSTGSIVDEAERSLHDALCVVRSLVKEKYLMVGGSAPEIEVALGLEAESKLRTGMDSFIFRRYGEAFEVIPYTLAENAGLHPIAIVTDLRAKHASGLKTHGINIKKGIVSDMKELGVVQPLLVSTSAIKLATETVAIIMKIDDVILVRGF